MLTPEQLEQLPKQLVQTYTDMEADILNDICRRFREAGSATSTAIEQIRALREQGFPMAYIEKRIRQALSISQEQLDDMFDEAVEDALQFNRQLYDKLDLTAPRDDALKPQVDAIRRQTSDDMKNITQSLGFVVRQNVGNRVILRPYTIAQTYQRILDKAEIEILSGAMDYQSAIAKSVKELADSGIRYIHYEKNGRVWTNNADVAVRRAVLTGIHQVSGEYANRAAEQLGTTLMEITAHAGARPSHQQWQGKIVDKSGRNPKYLTLDDIGYGRVDGFKGANCRHDWYPFIEGISVRAYTDAELRNIDPKPITYEGVKYDAYAATQMQRKLEDAMRRQKRRIIGFRASGQSEQKKQAEIKLKALERKYADFSKKAGIKQKINRASVQGY